MSEYIDRQALLDAIPPTKEDKQISLCGAVADFISLVCDVPAADVAPVVHGKWIRIDDPEFICGDFECSNCSHREYDVDTDELMPGENCLLYCPNCGAKMDENEVENLERCSCGDRQYCPEVEKDENGKWFIRCYRCRKIVWGNTIEEAVNAWNGSQNCGIETDGGDTDV